MGNRAMYVIFLVFLVSIFSTNYGHSTNLLVEQRASFSTNGNETVNASGCTNISANNYNENATYDDGSCDFDFDNDGVVEYDEVNGCMDNYATNYDIYATDDDGSCTYVNYEDGSFQHTYWQGYIHGALVRQHEPSFVKFSPDGSYYATHHDGIIQIWDSINASITHSIYKTISNFSDYWIVDLDWSPNGSHFAIILTDDLFELEWSNRWISSVITYDLGNDEYTILGTHEYNTNYDIEYSPDGDYLGVALGNELVVYDLLSGDKYLNYSFGDCSDYCDAYNYLSWDPKSENLSLVYNFFGMISLHDFESNLIVKQIEIHYLGELASFSPDGNKIAVCTGNDNVAVFDSTDFSILWQIITADLNHLSNYNSACNEIAWAPDSTRFAVAYDGKGKHGSSVLVYDANTSEILDWFGPPRPNECLVWICASIEGLDWSPDGYRIIFAADYVEQGIHTLVFDADVNFILGCTDYTARNYNPHATRTDYSCEWLSDETDTEDNYIGYWDNCEWDDDEGEYLCWVENLAVLSADQIEELQDCTQTENGCETEVYCEETAYGIWECPYRDVVDDDDEVSSFISEISGETVAVSMLVVVTIIVATMESKRGISKSPNVEVTENEEKVVKEEKEEFSPKSIEIDVRELK